MECGCSVQKKTHKKKFNLINFKFLQVYLLNRTFLLQTWIYRFFQNFKTNISNILGYWSHNKFPRWLTKSKMATMQIELFNGQIQLYILNCTFLVDKCIYHFFQNEKTNIVTYWNFQDGRLNPRWPPCSDWTSQWTNSVVYWWTNVYIILFRMKRPI